VQSFFRGQRYFIVRSDVGLLPYINLEIESERRSSASTGTGTGTRIATETGTATTTRPTTHNRQDRRRYIPEIKRHWSEKLEERKKELEILTAELDKADQTGWWKKTG
jgi:Tfp pilus assembly protein PilN